MCYLTLSNRSNLLPPPELQGCPFLLRTRCVLALPLVHTTLGFPSFLSAVFKWGHLGTKAQQWFKEQAQTMNPRFQKEHSPKPYSGLLPRGSSVLSSQDYCQDYSTFQFIGPHPDFTASRHWLTAPLEPDRKESPSQMSSSSKSLDAFSQQFHADVEKHAVNVPGSVTSFNGMYILALRQY